MAIIAAFERILFKVYNVLSRKHTLSRYNINFRQYTTTAAVTSREL
jgi:hypothetical protein